MSESRSRRASTAVNLGNDLREWPCPGHVGAAPAARSAAFCALRRRCCGPRKEPGRPGTRRYPSSVDFTRFGFRRINALPPYAFAQIDALKMEFRRAGEDVIDLAFGNPDIPSPTVAVEKLAEAVHNPRNHRYSTSKGIPKLRMAVADLYKREFDVDLDFETEVCSTIGAKEGFSHLMLTLVGPGDTALVPSPSYPIHIWGPILAGAAVHYVRMGPDQDFFANLHTAYEEAWPRPRVLVTSFPHNPTTACVDLAFMERL